MRREQRPTDLARKCGHFESDAVQLDGQIAGEATTEATRLRQLEDYNSTITKLMAEQMLDSAALHEPPSKIFKAAARREAVAHLRAEWGPIGKRACCIVSADPKMMGFRSYRPPETKLYRQLRSPMPTGCSATTGC